MKKSAKKVLCPILTAVMLLAACATEQEGTQPKGASGGAGAQGESQGESQSGEVSKYPEYLNVDSPYPIIKDEYAGNIKLKLAIVLEPSANDWDELWLSKYWKEKYNVEFDVEVMTTEALYQKKNLMFQSGELPDIMINMEVVPQEQIKYGTDEGLLLKLDEYMDETLTPNILKYMDYYNAGAISTAPDGHMYTLPRLLSDTDVGGAYHRLFINEKWLKDLGLEMPKTLDEFTQAMYKIKESDPAGVGSENVYPFGGGMFTRSNTYYLLNALGYMTVDPQGLSPALRDGQVVIPAYDTDVFKEFLTLLNQYYNDGIINPNFFTIEDSEVLAQLSNGQSALFRDPVYTTGYEGWPDWSAPLPLTSKWQEEPEWIGPDLVTVGGFAISADTKYPELCMRIADTYFNTETDNCMELWLGAPEDDAYSFGMTATCYDAETKAISFDENALKGLSSYEYLLKYVAGRMPFFGAVSTQNAKVRYAEAYGWDVDFEMKFDLTNGDSHYRSTVYSNLVPYAGEHYPSTTFISTEDADRISEITAVAHPVITENIALFVTGKRPLSEIDDFKKEMTELGMGEVLEIYQKAYTALQ